jgi:glycosyltransferase involved in cell wall biosynthesis
MPTLNAAKTLRQCLRQVVSQDYPAKNVEIVVVDGGSTDDTLSVCEEFGVKTIIQRSRSTEGFSGAKAIGSRAAGGQYICFLDSDNFIYPRDWIRMMIKPLESNGEVAFCEPSRMLNRSDSAINRFCSYYAIYTPSEDPFILSYQRARGAGTRRMIGYESGALIYKADLFPPALANGAVIRRETLEGVGGFDYDIDVGRRLVRAGYNTFARSLRAQVNHEYVGSFGQLIRKAKSRSLTYLMSSEKSPRTPFMASSDYMTATSLSRTFLRSVLPVSQTLTALKSMREWHDPAWLYYPATALVVSLVYATSAIAHRDHLMALAHERGK